MKCRKKKYVPFVRLSGSKKLLLLGSALMLLIMSVLAFGCSDNSTDEGQQQTAAQGDEQVVLKEKQPVTEDAVANMVTRKVGTIDYSGAPIIHYINVTPEADGKFVDIGVGRPPSCHPGQVVGYITEMSRGFMSSLFLYPDVARVQVTLFGTTEEAATKDETAARALMTKADAAKVTDWFAFTENTISEMATDYWVEPQIYENWQKFGSSTITDPSLLEEANQ